MNQNVIIADGRFIHDLANYGVIEIASTLSIGIQLSEFTLHELDVNPRAMIMPLVKKQLVQVNTFNGNQMAAIVAIMQQYHQCLSLADASVIYLLQVYPGAVLVSEEATLNQVAQAYKHSYKPFQWFFKQLDKTGITKKDIGH